jgi:GNAT superfamily N-acetyltransferase
MYGYCWVTFRRTPVAEIRGEIEPGANEAYLYDGFVVPRRRGKGVLRQLYAEIFTWLRDRGYRAALGVVLASNTPSVRAIRHEWSLVGKVSYFRLLQFEQYKYDKENPELSRFTLEQPVKTIP